MYGHPIIVNITAVILTIPTFFKALAKLAKDEAVELKEDVGHAVRFKKSYIRSNF